MQRPLIVALDVHQKEARDRLLETFKHDSIYMKVGMELYYQEGPRIIEQLKKDGHHVFLDLKLHDIPNTVGRAMKVLSSLEVDMINVHAAGGRKMMEAALEGLEAGKPANAPRPKLIAVTQLTSTDQEMLTDELLIKEEIAHVVSTYAALAKKSGLDGVVSSALEVPLIHEVCGEDFLTVTPGIRRLSDAKGDQKRIVTPMKAKELGSWGIVVGRSITESIDPYQTYLEMKKEWEEGK
ncbi:orotidine 5'-phosphate decarboxylase [Alkalihalophilus pseudofirmus OF4]|uniref:Orotidine 5'-phosphate decarboxylase n=1 Tax=Alkalihalophilus pseudofirmus (strain ATCC BAA-2126 / JCM 17055 / OF4) TaxID=398511 RepID=D3FTA5_ALKPO|nr:orotidine-5'-phosphate decarboxylase [Alkalihalophilus pseudofirmus]ADC48173.1 orotidine 5'-phosphate decarboxylase [Alkalihalophilus pseudofirmus OF4]